MKRFFIIMLLLAPLYSVAQLITTIAGGGAGGDGRPTISESISHPITVVYDQSGNIYFSEEFGHKICKMDAAGIITIVAGTGSAGYAGDGGLAIEAKINEPGGLAVDSIGNLFVADIANHVIRKIDVATGIISTICGNGWPGFSGDGGLAAYTFTQQTMLASDAYWQVLVIAVALQIW